MSKDNLKHAKDTLELEFMFKPMKPIKVSFDLLITKKEGSRWRFRVVLEGTDPEVDDVIEIESNLMVTSTVSFKVTNVDKSSVPFKAKFTSDSGTYIFIQPINFLYSQKKECLLHLDPKVQTFIFPTLQWNMENKRKESS